MCLVSMFKPPPKPPGLPARSDHPRNVKRGITRRVPHAPFFRFLASHVAAATSIAVPRDFIIIMMICRRLVERRRGAGRNWCRHLTGGGGTNASYFGLPYINNLADKSN